MDKKIFNQRSKKLIEFLFGIYVFGIVIAIFLSEKIAEHRMQAISFIIGIALILWGMDIIVKKDFVYPINIFKKKSVIEKGGKSAEIIGIIIAILGILLSIWGALFWITFFRNI